MSAESYRYPAFAPTVTSSWERTYSLASGAGSLAGRRNNKAGRMLNWFRHLEDARNTEELIAIVRDHFATWTPADLALLPAPCRPGRMKSARDLEELHVALVEEYRTSSAEGEALAALQRLTSFVVRASVRNTQLRDDDDPPQGSSGGGSPPRSAAPRRS